MTGIKFIFWPVRILVLGSLFCLGTASTPAAEDAFKETWNVSQFLPGTAVTGIAQTPDGYLWLAASAGLFRFDGTNMESVPVFSSKNKSADKVTALFASREGSLWVALADGAALRKVGNLWETIVPGSTENNPSNSEAETVGFAQDESGAIWIGRVASAQGNNKSLKLFRWNDGKLASFNLNPKFGIAAPVTISPKTKGQLWVSTPQGTNVFSDGTLQQESRSDTLNVRIARAAGGGLWERSKSQLSRISADGSSRTVVRLQVSEETATSLPAGTEDGTVDELVGAIRTMCEDADGALWFGTKGLGLFRCIGDRVFLISSFRSEILTLMEDSYGNMWAGTRDGLFRVSRGAFRIWQRPKGLPPDRIISMVRDNEDRLWIASEAGSVARGQDPKNRRLVTVPELNRFAVSSLARDPKAGIWFGTNEGGIYRMAEGNKPVEVGRIPAAIRFLFCEDSGKVWAATRTGQLFSYTGETWKSEKLEAAWGAPYTLEADKAGKLWLGTEGGYVLAQDDSGHFIPSSAALLDGVGKILFITPDPESGLWIGCEKKGLLKLDQGNVWNVSAPIGLWNYDVRSMRIDGAGTFWLTVERDLFRIPKEDMARAIASHKDGTALDAGYQVNEMKSVSFTGYKWGKWGGVQTETSDGRLWFGALEGVIEMIPEHLPLADTLPPVHIEQLSIGGRDLEPDGRPLKLHPDAGLLEIRYNAPFVSGGKKVRFRYRLLGYIDEWTPIESGRFASYRSLPPGNFEFQVEACLGQRSWKDASKAVLPIVVQYEWYESTAFRVVLGFITLTVIVSVARALVARRFQIRIKRLETENLLERERSRIARDMHDELGSGLTRIAFMGDLASGDQTSAELKTAKLKEISQVARNVSSMLDGLVWTVNPRNDHLEGLIQYLGEFASEFCRNVGLDLRLHFPEDLAAEYLPSEFRLNVLSATKEVFNNIAKHSGASSVVFEITTNQGILSLKIADNGCGLPSEVESGFSNGFKNLKHRVKILGGEMQVQNHNGCTVVFLIPMPAN